MRTAVQMAGYRGQHGVVDERGLARARDAGHTGEKPNRERDVDLLQIVTARAAHDELLLRVRGSALRWQLDTQATREVAAGERVRVGGERLGGALADDFAPVDARPGAEIDDVVAGADGVLVVFHHEHRVAQIAQMFERRDQAFVVALVQTDRRLVEHVKHPGEARADLAGQADALTFTAGERLGGAIEREVVETDVNEKLQARGDFAHDAFPDRRPRAGQHELFKPAQRLAQGPVRELRNRSPGDPDEARLDAQTRSFASGTGFDVAVLAELLADGGRVGFAPASL